MRPDLGTRVRRSAVCIAAVILGSLVSGGVVQTAVPAAAAGAQIAPHATGEMDCNGWSPQYASVRPGMKMLCTDPMNPRGRAAGQTGWGDARFYDNGHYVGHDEPSVRFLSSAAGSGNTMTYFTQLPTEPASGTNYAELSSAPWFGLPICDPNSFPFASCTADSDSNAPPSNSCTPGACGGGSAVMELQFYPPGFGPFIDGFSCDATRWCAALTIDSIENSNNCVEPVNFAFLTLDGRPTGPPSPQQANAQTLTPNADTLFFGQGDTLRVDIKDTSSGVMTRVDDFTTGQSGFMVASGANGFMNTDPNFCTGSPFNFHPEFSTAAAANIVPWAALEIGVTATQEIGHFEPCTTLSHPDSASLENFPPGFSDPSLYQTCGGASEVSNNTNNGNGEGACTDLQCSNTTGSNADVGEAAGGTQCNSTLTNGSGNLLCEVSDGYCVPAGSRTVTVGGAAQTWSWPLNGCEMNQFQNGDLDFDGTPYQADWPDGSSAHPTSAKYLGPFDPSGHLYSQLQFESDAPGSMSTCNTSNGSGCAVPPPSPSGTGSAFYPFWSTETSQQPPALHPVSGACAWNFGNDVSGVTTDDFSKDTQYGSSDTGHFRGNVISSPQTNPPGGCTNLTLAQVDPASALRLTPASGNHTQGSTFAVTVTAVDASGSEPATGFTDRVHFASSDGAASLPADYTFSAADGATHTFSVTLSTLGSQTVTVSDVTTGGVTPATGTYGVMQTQQDVFWQDGAGHLEEIWYAGGSWHGPLDLTATFFGGAAPLQSAPSAEMMPDGSQQLVFWTGPGSHLFEAWYSNGWHGPLDLSGAFLGGAVLQSAPSAQVLPDGSQQLVFWQGAGGALTEAWYAGGTWHGPLDLTNAFFGGVSPLQSAPSAQVMPDGSQQLVFWQGNGNHAVEAWYSNGWHGPLDLTSTFLGGAAPLQSSPSATVLPDESQQLLFWQGPGGGLNEAWYAGGSWHGPLDLTAAFLGGVAPLQSSPSATVLPDGSQQLAFWQGPGGHLDEAWYAGGGWHGPVDWTIALGAPPMASAPSAAIEPIF